MLRFNSYFCFLLLFISIPFSVFAEDVYEDEELIVTGSHTPISINEIGSSYTIITQEQIQKRQTIFVSDLLRDVPGFAVSHTGVRGTVTQVRVRGAEANQLLVLIDGIEANDIGSGDEFDFANLVTTDIERIEIIRGPQSALYGSDAIAGVVNIITKKGGGPTRFNVFSEAGSFGTIFAGGNVSGGGERYHFNLAGSHLRVGGSNISREGDEEDGYNNDTVSFSGGITLLDNLKFNMTARHVEAANDFDGTDFVVTGLPIDADNTTEISRDYLQGQLKLGLFNNAWDHSIGAALTSTENDVFALGVESTSTRGKKIKFNYQTNVYFDYGNSSNIFTFAVDHEKDLFKQKDFAFGGASNQKQSAETTGYVLGYKTGLWERLFLSASVRKDDNSRFKNTVTYRTTAAFKVTETDTQLHASYGTGVKRPTFTDLFGFFPGTFVGNPDLKSEKSKEWEVGVEQALFSEKLNVGVTYFKATLKDEITTIFGAPSTAANLTGKSKRKGVEIHAGIELLANLNLTGTYTWLNPTEANAAGAQVYEIRRPRNIASLNLDYVFLNERADINLNVSFNGSQDDTVFNPTIPPFGANERVRLGSYTLINLAGSYKLTDIVNVYARVENAFDKDYEDVIGFQTPGLAGYAGFNLTLNP